MQTKRNVWLWVLYDLANSIVMITFFMYFSQWVVVDRGMSDFAFNVTFSISALLLLLTVPTTGNLLDKYWRRITGIRYTTVLAFLLYGITAIFAVYNLNMPALIFFTLATYMYLLSFTFYTPLINDIAHESKRGFVSGLGISANYTGQFLGLIIALPFANGVWNIFGGTARAETLFPATVIFLILTLPMLIFFKEEKKAKVEYSIVGETKNVIKDTKKLFMYSGVGLFILAYFLFNDAVLTAANNFPIFLENVWNVSDNVKTYIMLGILITSGIGGTVSGIIADKFGHKRTLMIVVIGLAVIFTTISLAQVFWFFVAGAVFMGFWFASIWAVSRSVMAYLAPKDGHNLTFGYFGLAERASSLIGPIVWSLTVAGFSFMEGDKYRMAMLVITIFILIGIIVLSRVRSDRTA